MGEEISELMMAAIAAVMAETQADGNDQHRSPANRGLPGLRTIAVR